MTGILFIRDLAVVMVAAGAAAWFCQRVGLSVVVGYLVAGAVVGPHTPPFALVSNVDRVQTLAQVGLVFLVFAIGLNLSFSRLRRLGLSIVVATAVGAILVLLGARVLVFAMGGTVAQGLFLAGILMVSSSAIISKVLDELNATHERFGQLALGMTVLEDVVAVIMLTLLTSLMQFGGGEADGKGLLPTLGGLGAFVVLIVLVALLLVPKLLGRLSAGAPAEIRTLVVTGLLLSLGWLAFEMGYSLALGAFLLGAIIGSTRHKADIDDVFEGVRHIFGAVFFVAVGMLVDFRLLVDVWPMVLGVTALALLLRPLACALGLMAVGTSTREAVPAAVALVPLGEFSYIIAQLGTESGAVPASFFPVAVGASLLTSLAAPVLMRRAEPLADWVLRVEPPAMRAWVGLYRDWLYRLRGRSNANLLWQLTRKRLVQVGLSMLVVSAVILVANPLYDRVRGVLGDDWLFPMGVGVVYWSLLGLVVLAPTIAIWRSVSALAMMLAEGATQGGVRERRMRPVLEFTLRTVGFFLLGAWLLALLPSGQAVAGVVLLVVLFLSVVAFILRRRLARWQSRLEVELLQQLKRASHATATSAWSAELVKPSNDWELEIDEVTLPRDSAHGGKAIGKFALRKEYGCSIVGIDRQGFGIVNPGADTILYPRDKLLVLGAPEQLAKAARMLGASASSAEGPTGFDELTMEMVVVPRGSRLLERTLIELDLIRQAGVQLGGIRRNGQSNLAPSGRDTLLAGDELLVLGTSEQIKRFRAWIVPDEPVMEATEGNE
ncbi:MAG: cation:proton antiporter [Verrucomicrobiae bacterium]|nr:cation:proton antiporter [Verrucomicrobiae bacterium]